MAGPPLAEGVPALTAAEIAVLVGGKVEGDAAWEVRGVAPLDRAGPDQLAFLADKRYAGLLTESRAGVVLVAPEFHAIAIRGQARIVVDKPHDALVSLLPRFYRAPDRPEGVHSTADVGAGVRMGAGVAIGAGSVIGSGAVLGDRAWIGPLCVVGDGVSIGADSRLVSQVTCYPGTIIGERVTLHAGVRIGSDGFGYAYSAGAHNKIPHVGRCIIQDDVEIGANSAIDRGSIDDTVIGAGTKIDNLVHVAHNVRIGRLCLLMGQVGIAGSVHIGDGVVIAGQTGVTGHVTIGAKARLAGRSGAISDIPAGETWAGFPARPHKEWLRATAALMRLAPLLKRIERFLNDNE